MSDNYALYQHNEIYRLRGIHAELLAALKDAAAEIERLRAELEQLKKETGR
jgi:hypothetical protein